MDITHIVRFLEGSGPAPERPDVISHLEDDQAASALRLILSHTALDTGRILVSEDEDGIVGVSVWMSTLDSSTFASMSGILDREVGLHTQPLGDVDVARVAADKAANLAEVIRGAHPQWTLVLAARRDELEDDIELLAALVQPVLKDATGPVLSVLARPIDSCDLEDLGFAELESLPISDEHKLWIGQFAQ